jgi:hypothetical protein
MVLTIHSSESERQWRVCEHCADRLTREARCEGFEVMREVLG